MYSQSLLNRLTVWTKSFDKINNSQFEYQKEKSTVDCVFILHSLILKLLSSGRKVDSVFIMKSVLIKLFT